MLVPVQSQAPGLTLFKSWMRDIVASKDAKERTAVNTAAAHTRQDEEL
jgi:hypothetical protein